MHFWMFKSTHENEVLGLSRRDIVGYVGNGMYKNFPCESYTLLKINKALFHSFRGRQCEQAAAPTPPDGIPSATNALDIDVNTAGRDGTRMPETRPFAADFSSST